MGNSENKKPSKNSQNNQNGNKNKNQENNTFIPEAAEKLPEPVNSRQEEAAQEDVKKNPLPFLKTLKHANPFNYNKDQNNNQNNNQSSNNNSSNQSMNNGNNNQNNNSNNNRNSNNNSGNTKKKKLRTKFVNLSIKRQVYIILGLTLLIPLFFHIPGLVILITVCIIYLVAGLTGKKFLLTYLVEKAPWNNKLEEFEENNNSNYNQNNNSNNNGNSNNNSGNNSNKTQNNNQRSNNNNQNNNSNNSQN